jgi:hypothetical protein
MQNVWRTAAYCLLGIALGAVLSRQAPPRDQAARSAWASDPRQRKPVAIWGTSSRSMGPDEPHVSRPARSPTGTAPR